MITKHEIENASWLTDSQKSRLTAVYSTVRLNDIDVVALEMLNLASYGAERITPLEYKSTIIDIMSLVSGCDIAKDRLADYLKMLKMLYVFFDTLDDEDFHTLCDIECAYSLTDRNERESRIESLYKGRIDDAKRLLEALKVA
jgi:hypothetical protein